MGVLPQARLWGRVARSATQAEKKVVRSPRPATSLGQDVALETIPVTGWEILVIIFHLPVTPKEKKVV